MQAEKTKLSLGPTAQTALLHYPQIASPAVHTRYRVESTSSWHLPFPFGSFYDFNNSTRRDKHFKRDCVLRRRGLFSCNPTWALYLDTSEKCALLFSMALLLFSMARRTNAPDEGSNIDVVGFIMMLESIRTIRKSKVRGQEASVSSDYTGWSYSSTQPESLEPPCRYRFSGNKVRLTRWVVRDVPLWGLL